MRRLDGEPVTGRSPFLDGLDGIRLGKWTDGLFEALADASLALVKELVRHSPRGAQLNSRAVTDVRALGLSDVFLQIRGVLLALGGLPAALIFGGILTGGAETIARRASQA